MRISVYGAGYVGLVSACCLAKLGHHVVCADIDEQKVEKLQKGECPIYEEQLPDLLQEQLETNRLLFTNDLNLAIQNANAHFIATGTPSLPDGSADLSQVFAVVARIAREANTEGVLITKSTVPVGTGDQIQALVRDELSRCNKNITLHVASNPEFLREGTAVNDFLNANRIVIGGEDQALHLLRSIYQPLIEKGIPVLSMSRRSAELSKYAANAFLACKVSFINYISQLAEEFDANIDDIREGMSLDFRIGPHFLQAGVGYGGSCFPKDVLALIQLAKSQGIDAKMLEATEEINRGQKNWAFKRVFQHFEGRLAGLIIGVWGLAFKPGTDDLREASSLVTIKALEEAQVELRLFDPVAGRAARQLFQGKETLTCCESAEAVLDKKVDALIIITEWPEFKNFPLERLKEKLGTAPLFDGRNCFGLTQVAQAQLAHYYSVGRPVVREFAAFRSSSGCQ
jgi:UDPglucose 6-dehydrogenase